MSNFQKELTELINSHCLENESDSPDFILAEYMLDTLDAYNDAVKKREAWYGRKTVMDSPQKEPISAEGYDCDCRD